MLRRLLTNLLIISFSLAAAAAFAQPFDLLIPEPDSPDSLTRELRSIQSVERDLAIEKLTREPTRLEAYIELAELRRTQGKLQEAKRFYEMALEMDPENGVANQGMAMVHYHKGEFDLARDRMDLIFKANPLSDHLKSELEIYRKNLQNNFQVAINVREDDRGLSETVSSIDSFFPSSHFRKLSGRYRFENWSHSDNGSKTSTQVYSSTLDYNADENTSLSLTYAPEFFPNGTSIAGYQLQSVAGTDNLKIALRAGKCSFKENIFTVQNQFFEENAGVSLFGDLHKRTRIIQSILVANISDGNARRRYDSELIHCFFRNSAPFITTNLRFYQLSYEKQFDQEGNQLKYWAPSDLKGAELSFSWERKVGAYWWWGIDTSLITNQYRNGTGNNGQESGIGGALQIGYRFSTGNLYFSLGDNLHDYFRERKLEVSSNFTF